MVNRASFMHSDQVPTLYRDDIKPNRGNAIRKRARGPKDRLLIVQSALLLRDDAANMHLGALARRSVEGW
jgi:hypothetical protein